MLYVSKFGNVCVVCHRVADMPDPKVPSVRQKCAHCHAQIWVANWSPVGPPTVCLTCATHFGASTARRSESKHRDMHQRRGGRRLH